MSPRTIKIRKLVSLVGLLFCLRRIVGMQGKWNEEGMRLFRKLEFKKTQVLRVDEPRGAKGLPRVERRERKGKD